MGLFDKKYCDVCGEKGKVINIDHFSDFFDSLIRLFKKDESSSYTLIDTIQYNKEVDDFDNFVQVKNSKYSINDNAEYSPEELLKEIEQN